MPFMKCPPGAAVQMFDGTRYIDTGLGSVMVDDRHVNDVYQITSRQWTLSEDEPQASIDEALDRLAEGVEQEQEKVDALREEVIQQVPAPERADVWDAEEQAVFDERWVSEHERTQAGPASSAAQATEGKTDEVPKPSEEPPPARRVPRR